jgi:uncharacterized membrane protein
LYSSGLSTAMVYLMKWATSLILFTRFATRVIVAKIKSLAVQIFQSRTWGKDVIIARTLKMSTTQIILESQNSQAFEPCSL